MPRMINYKPNSIIYFNNDKADSVYLLKAGKVSLVYNDSLSGEVINDVINNGEFFGVKSGLIRYPREETARVVVNSTVLEFSSAEFEALITKNTHIIIKMLRSFSNQLRRVGKQVQGFVTNKISSDPASDFFQIGDYYLKNKKYKQAVTVFQRYLHYYPDGELTAIVEERIETAKSALDTYGNGAGPTPMLNKITLEGPVFEEKSAEDFVTEGSGNTEFNSVEKHYYNGISLMSKKSYEEALSQFEIVTQMDQGSLSVSAKFEIGKCYLALKKYDLCIKLYKEFLTLSPNFNKISEVFYYMALAFKNSGNKAGAKEHFEKILSLEKVEANLARKVENALKELE